MRIKKSKDGTIEMTAESKEDSKDLFRLLMGDESPSAIEDHLIEDCDLTIKPKPVNEYKAKIKIEKNGKDQE